MKKYHTIKAKFVPYVLLLDIWMSGQDGREICKFLKAQKNTKDISILMVSASLDIEESAKGAGANDFLAKPFMMDDLLHKIERLVNASKSN